MVPTPRVVGMIVPVVERYVEVAGSVAVLRDKVEAQVLSPGCGPALVCLRPVCEKATRLGNFGRMLSDDLSRVWRKWFSDEVVWGFLGPRPHGGGPPLCRDSSQYGTVGRLGCD